MASPIPPNRGAQALVEIINTRGWSHDDAARAIGKEKSDGLISRLCSGERLPSRRVASRLASVLGIPVSHWDEPATGRAA